MLTLNEFLLVLLMLSLMIWVGGALTGQIWMFRAGLHGDVATRAILLPQINWIIRYVYIPMAATAFMSGILLAWRNDIPWTTPWLLFPVVVFLATILVGSIYSLPEYARLVQHLRQGKPQDSNWQRRIEVAAWVNRVELLLVIVGLIGLIVQP